jgi:hypothetical protein
MERIPKPILQQILYYSISDLATLRAVRATNRALLAATWALFKGHLGQMMAKWLIDQAQYENRTANSWLIWFISKARPSFRVKPDKLLYDPCLIGPDSGQVAAILGLDEFGLIFHILNCELTDYDYNVPDRFRAMRIIFMAYVDQDDSHEAIARAIVNATDRLLNLYILIAFILRELLIDRAKFGLYWPFFWEIYSEVESKYRVDFSFDRGATFKGMCTEIITTISYRSSCEINLIYYRIFDQFGADIFRSCLSGPIAHNQDLINDIYRLGLERLREALGLPNFGTLGQW